MLTWEGRDLVEHISTSIFAVPLLIFLSALALFGSVGADALILVATGYDYRRCDSARASAEIKRILPVESAKPLGLAEVGSGAAGGTAHSPGLSKLMALPAS